MEYPVERDKGAVMTVVVGTIGELPIFPENYARVLDLAQRDDVDLGVLVPVVERDVGLATTLLKAANSSYWGGGGSIRTVRAALVRLGLKAFRGYVMSTAMRFFVREGDLVSRRIWEHLVWIGECCRRLADSAGKDGDEAYVWGLLHDVGWLVMRQRMPEMVEEIIHDVAERVGSDAPVEDVIESLELEKHGFTHAEVGALVCRRWNLDESVARTIEMHHRPEDFASQTVWLADRMCPLVWECVEAADYGRWGSVSGYRDVAGLEQMCREAAVDVF